MHRSLLAAIVAALCLSFLGCRIYFTTEELSPGASFRPEEHPEAALALLEFYLDPASRSLAEERRHVLRLVHLNEAGKEDHSESLEVSAGHRLLLLRPGLWQVLEVCATPCKSYAVRSLGDPRFWVEPGAVNYAGTFLVTLYPQDDPEDEVDPELEVRAFSELAQEALATLWPQVSHPFREAMER